MQARSAPPPLRHAPFLQNSLHAPSMPIPIPASRKVTDPPPRSPDRNHLSSDLLFDMSPISSEDTPLKHHHLPSIHGPSALPFHRKPYNPFTRPLGGLKDVNTDHKPYSNEPFLYSIPRIACNVTSTHARCQSETISTTKSPTEAFSPSTPVASPRERLPSFTARLSSTSISGVKSTPLYVSVSQEAAENPLTSAFQNSVTSETSSSPSSPSPSHYALPERLIATEPRIRVSDPPSNRTSPTRQPRRTTSTAYPPLFMRASAAAAPVLSFAQAELSGPMITNRSQREVRNVNRNKPKSPPSCTSASRARSPYTFHRGRRNSILRDRSLRISDEDLNGSLTKDGRTGGAREKFGLDKFANGVFPRRVAVDENAAKDILAEKERGRTRSRGRVAVRA
ncbi:hypothetical protein C8Q75DRAFT_331602 [Abortiporus biennis]|nr:hypothetical protein C8Q75DRAFT_331602 [Abortiporus biennis]